MFYVHLWYITAISIFLLVLAGMIIWKKDFQSKREFEENIQATLVICLFWPVAVPLITIALVVTELPGWFHEKFIRIKDENK